MKQYLRFTMLMFLVIFTPVKVRPAILQPHDAVLAIKWDGSGRYLLSSGLQAGEDQFQMAGWNISSLYKQNSSKTPQFYLQSKEIQSFSSVEWLRSGQILTGNEQGVVQMWQLKKHGGSVEEVTAFALHQKKITYIRYNPFQNGEFASLGADKNLKVVDAFSKVVLHSFNFDQKFSDFYWMNPNVIWLVNNFGEFYSLELSTKVVQKIDFLEATVHDIDRRRRILIKVASDDSGIELVNMENGKILLSFDLDLSYSTHLDYESNAENIGICDDDSVWAFHNNGSMIFENHKKIKGCTTIQWHPLSDLLAVGDQSGTVTVWKMSTGEIIKTNLSPGYDQDTDPIAEKIIRLAVFFGLIMMVFFYTIWKIHQRATLRVKKVTNRGLSLLYPKHDG